MIEKLLHFGGDTQIWFYSGLFIFLSLIFIKIVKIGLVMFKDGEYNKDKLKPILSWVGLFFITIFIFFFTFSTGTKRGTEVDIEEHSLTQETLKHVKDIPTDSTIQKNEEDTRDHGMSVLKNDSVRAAYKKQLELDNANFEASQLEIK